MDPPEDEEERNIARRRFTKRRLRVLIRCFFTFGLFIVASFVFSILVGFASLWLGDLSPSASVSMPSTCKILSSSVDIRSSKVCKLGLFNYKTTHVIYPSDKRGFRCHDDYYWASIFQVEYKEYFSGQTYQAIAEAPKEALPQYCRPNFSTAWLARLKFKVNETYNCRYTLGKKADIYSDNNTLFNCEPEDPSVLELIRRLSILFIQSYLSDNFNIREFFVYAIGGVVAGVLGGFLTSSFAISVLNAINRFLLSIYDKNCSRFLTKRFGRIFLFTLYLSAIGWFTLEYSRFIGLRQLVLELESRFKRWIV